MLMLWLLLQAIPEERTADWSRAGLPALPLRTRVVEVQGDPQVAIDAAQPDDILFLPEGIYDGLRLKSRITLRGAGPFKTILKGPIHIGIGGADWWYPHRLRVDVVGKRGVDVLRCDASKLKPGMVVQLARGVDFLQRQVTQIVATTPTSVTVSPAPLFDLPEGSRLAPGGRMAEFVGVEDLAVEDAGHIGINITGGYGCWVKNVAVSNLRYAHISLTDSLFCEITRCFIASRIGDDAAGLRLGTSSFCKIEDNVFADTQVEVSASSGNVVACNYFRDFELYGGLGPSISAVQHSGFNLYEANVAPKLQIDGAAPETVFRNRLHGTSTTTQKHLLSVNLRAGQASVVGNVLGAPTAGVVDSKGVADLPASLYLKSKPAWWGDRAWPPFGPDLVLAKNKIPAETR